MLSVAVAAFALHLVKKLRRLFKAGALGFGKFLAVRKAGRNLAEYRSVVGFFLGAVLPLVVVAFALFGVVVAPWPLGVVCFPRCLLLRFRFGLRFRPVAGGSRLFACRFRPVDFFCALNLLPLSIVTFVLFGVVVAPWPLGVVCFPRCLLLRFRFGLRFRPVVGGRRLFAYR